MTKEQDNKLSERLKEYTETFKDYPASLDFEMGKIAGFVKGVKDVVNNPSEYGLMVVPSIQEVEDWLTTEKDLSPEEVITWTGGVVYDLLTGAFEHFKNRNIEKAQDNNSGE